MSPETRESGGAARVVVAVVSWNTRDLLDRCLRSLERYASDGTAEVWVVDNGSSDGSVEMVRERHGWVRLVESGENLGYGRAINLVAERTSSPWFALSNADIALRDGALEALLAAGEADPGAGMIAPRLILPDGSTQHSVWAFPTVTGTAVQNAGPLVAGARLADRLALQGAWNADRARRVPWAIGAFLLVRRQAWCDSGGFDAGQWMSAEDLDLGWRMRAAGWATRYEPRALVDHDESAATRQVWGSDLAIHWQRCAYAWQVRRMGRLRTVVAGALNFAGAGLRCGIDFALAGFRADDAVRDRARWALVHVYALAPRSVLRRYR